ncbi:hypothetical protein Tco_1521905, partial [Tanacetum coccineum]
LCEDAESCPIPEVMKARMGDLAQSLGMPLSLGDQFKQ